MEFYLSDDITPAPPAISHPVQGPQVNLLPGGEVHAPPSGHVTVEGGGDVRVQGSGHVVVPGSGEVRIDPGHDGIPIQVDAAHYAEMDTGYIVNEVA